MVCPKCGSPFALLILNEDIYEDHLCSKCNTWYHEDDDLGRLKKTIQILEIRVWLEQKQKYYNW